MKYQIVVETETESYPFTDDNRWTLWFPDEITAKRYVDKFESMYVYDTEDYDIVIEEADEEYTQDEALTLVKVLLDHIEFD